jgi:hypothetical protein
MNRGLGAPGSNSSTCHAVEPSLPPRSGWCNHWRGSSVMIPTGISKCLFTRDTNTRPGRCQRPRPADAALETEHFEP